MVGRLGVSAFPMEWAISKIILVRNGLVPVLLVQSDKKITLSPAG